MGSIKEKPALVMMIGLPGSGKTFYSSQIGYNRHSSDDLREKLFGDINDQKHNDIVFNTLHKNIRKDLIKGVDVVYDACNINSKRRMAFLKSVSDIDCTKIAIIVATPYEECLEQNRSRDRKVPEDVIKKMYLNWNIPYWFEGWENIDVLYPHGKLGFMDSKEIIDSLINYNQENSHHELTLGEHMSKCNQIVIKETNDVSIALAALLHDIGKPFTKSFIDKKGNQCSDAHYYQHHCVGAYESMFLNDYADKSVNCLDVGILVNLHMDPYFWENTPGLEERRRKLWGEELYEKVMMIHRADIAAH